MYIDKVKFEIERNKKRIRKEEKFFASVKCNEHCQSLQDEALKYNDKHRWKRKPGDRGGTRFLSGTPVNGPLYTVHKVFLNRGSGANDFSIISLPIFISKLSSKVLILLDRKSTGNSPFVSRSNVG